MSHPNSLKTLQHPAISNWKKCDSTFSEDALIRSFLNRVGLGEIKYSRILSQKLNTNLVESSVVVEKIIREMDKLNFPVYDVFLKADAVINFTALFVVNQDDFLDEAFLKVLGLSLEIEAKHRNEDFYFSHLFLPYCTNVKESYITSDGYEWKYAKRQGAPKARTA